MVRIFINPRDGIYYFMGLSRITKLIPSTLVALVVITGLVQILGWNALTIADKSLFVSFSSA